MIKFFRRIRKKLLAEGNTVKYFKYAVGEIVLVVIGILIALQINNWNENKKKKATFKYHLESLVEDLKRDQWLLSGINRDHSFRYHSMLYLLKMSNHRSFDFDFEGLEHFTFKPNDRWNDKIPQSYNKYFIQQAFLWTNRIAQYKSKQSAIDELKNRGFYSNIDNKIKRKLTEYYFYWEFYFPEKLLKNVEDWTLSLREDNVLCSETYLLEDPLSLIINNPKRALLMRQLIKDTNWMLKGNTYLTNESNELISLLEKEIESYK